MSNIINGTTLVEKESRSIGDVPVGGIVPWAKTLAGVPNLAEGWVECDGSVLVDSQSSLNGQTIPDLNGDNRFLRGNSTSGGTGGSETHNHNLDGVDTKVIEHAGVDFATIDLDSRQLTQTVSTLPTYYGVVWIMRVR